METEPAGEVYPHFHAPPAIAAVGVVLREIVQLLERGGLGDAEVIGREQTDRRGVRRAPERIAQVGKQELDARSLDQCRAAKPLRSWRGSSERRDRQVARQGRASVRFG